MNDRHKSKLDRGLPGLLYEDTDDPYIIKIGEYPRCRACMAQKFNVMIPLILRHGFPTMEHPMQCIKPLHKKELLA